MLKQTQFLTNFQNTLHEIVLIDELNYIDGIPIFTCSLDKNTWLNMAVVEKEIVPNTLAAIESYFRQKKRTPTFYFADEIENENLEKYLGQQNYKISSHEVWLEIKNPVIETDKFSQIKKVENETDLEIFLDICDRGFSANDPENPYGGLGEYLLQVKKSVAAVGFNNKINYYLIENNNREAVGVGCLTNYDEIGYISNLATLAKIHGEGYGKALLNYLVNQSVMKENKIHCLATELNSKPEKIYRHLGFEEMFRAKFYSKER